MADALCGPSNALQSFQKHTTVDRTLQQDRLTTRHSPSQGFRSSPGPNAGVLDPEFEAFQAGHLPLSHPEAQQFHSNAFPPSYAPQHLDQPTSNAWASDFQNLNIASPVPQFRQHNYVPQAQPRQLGNGWQDEFARQQNQPIGPVRSDHASYSSIPFQRLSTIAPMAPMQVSNYTMPANQVQLDQSLVQSAEAFDEEAFARAFDRAAQAELAKDQAAQQQAFGVDQDVLVNESAERLMGLDQVPETQRLGADLIHDPREGEKEQQQQQDDPDALARTAGQLLDSVKDNHSDKFHKSQFLELMRQLRDHEVTVEGDKIVGVQSGDSKDNQGLEKSLLSIARQLSLLDFTRVEPLLLHLPAFQSSSPSTSPSAFTTTTTHRPSTPSYLPLPQQLLLGAFARTLLHTSAALARLLTTHSALLSTATPFGLHIGVEVFALTRPPFDHLLASSPTYAPLRALVASFRRQFEELGIMEGMVRRAGEEGDALAEAEADVEAEAGVGVAVVAAAAAAAARQGRGRAEMELRGWLEEWLASVNARRQRQQQQRPHPWAKSSAADYYDDDDDNNSADDAEWVFSAAQIRALLGADAYPRPPSSSSHHAPLYTSSPSSRDGDYADTDTHTTAVERAAAPPQQQRPTQEHLDHIRAILGPQVVRALVRIWRSAHTRVFVNAVVGDVEALEEFVVGGGGGGDGGGRGTEKEIGVEEVFPLSDGRRSRRSAGEREGEGDWLAELEGRWEGLRVGMGMGMGRRGGGVGSGYDGYDYGDGAGQ